MNFVSISALHSFITCKGRIANSMRVISCSTTPMLSTFSLKSLLLIKNQALGQFFCHSIKHSQTIFTVEIPINIWAASARMIDFFCIDMAESSFLFDRKDPPLRSPKIVLILYPLLKNYVRSNGPV